MLQPNKVKAGFDACRHIMQTSELPTQNSNFQGESLFCSVHLSSIPFSFLSASSAVSLPCSCSLSPSLAFCFSSLFLIHSPLLPPLHFPSHFIFLFGSSCFPSAYSKVLNKQTSSGWLVSPIYNSSQSNYSVDVCQTQEIHLSA